MNQRLFVALITVAAFLAGYVARWVTQPGPAVPPAPAALAQEFARPVPAATERRGERQLDRARLVAEIHKLRPQIEAYSTRMQEIDAEFDREFAQLLSPALGEKYLASQRRYAERDAKRAAKREPLSNEEIQREQERSLTWVYFKVTVTPRLEMLTRDYGLDEKQQAAARSLLTLRRSKFLALFDSTPHLSIRLSGLAPLIERVAAPVTPR